MLHICMKTATPCCPERCRTKFSPSKTLACRHEMLDRANQGQYTLDAMKTADRRGDGQPKITSFTCQGHNNCCCHLTTYVNDELFRGEKPPAPTRRRSHPTDKDIRNIMTVNLQTLTPKWLSRQDCKIKFRRSQVQDDGTVTKLLFCYQTAWQQRLMHLYGQQMCLLDATYRTCRYSVPIFFLCVRTNVCYSVVGVFVTHSECSADVQEATNVFKEWNPSWQPTHFMVDFPEMQVLLCDFHREKAWIEWCRKRDHGVSRSDENSLLRLLRNVAKAATAKEYAEELQNLQSSDLWMGNENLRTWFGTKWIPQAKVCINTFTSVCTLSGINLFHFPLSMFSVFIYLHFYPEPATSMFKIFFSWSVVVDLLVYLYSDGCEDFGMRSSRLPSTQTTGWSAKTRPSSIPICKGTRTAA
ncbi:LOW QUALITY PROTEIN: uncharacterized protein LOC144915131 [Branchiostoma floridae x Branchiostoma belcheri]